MLGCDELVSTEDHVVRTLRANHESPSYAVVNTVERLPGDFTRDPDFVLPISLMRKKIQTSVAADCAHFVDANRIATALLGLFQKEC